MAGTAKLEKAYISLLAPSGSGGGGSLGQVTFQFNPKEYSVQKSASWESKPAKGAKQTSMPEFKGAEPRSMSIEIFLDANESASGSITKDIETLFQCCTPLEQSVDQNKPSPPFVLFGWGKTMSFTAFVKKVSAKYTLFRPDGTPTRAVCTVDLQELPREPGKQNPTSGGLVARRAHTMVAGDTLASIAQREYGDPRLWRAIAAANGIDDPMVLHSGTHLLLPAPAEAAGLA
jgi:nucleoid-associated protein YgaU